MAVVSSEVRRGFHYPWEFRFSQGPICGLSPSRVQRELCSSGGVRRYQKKHSAHAITADVDIVETVKAAEFFQANGVIVLGVSLASLRTPAK
jgi:hypothetical protein